MKKKYKKYKICVFKRNESYFIRSCFKKKTCIMYYEEEIQKIQNLCVEKNKSSFTRACSKKHASCITKKKYKKYKICVFKQNESNL